MATQNSKVRDRPFLRLVHDGEPAGPVRPVSSLARVTAYAGYRAEVFDARSGRKVRRTFSTPDEAKRWRSDAEKALHDGRLLANRPVTFKVTADAFLDGIRDGSIRNRSGDRYKPGVIREYERALRIRLLPALGAHKLADIRRADLRRLVGRWLAADLDPSTIRNTIIAARAIYRHALATDQVAVNPTTGCSSPPFEANGSESQHPPRPHH